ncbi:platelet endothelial cell adhesion molecule isoform X3 [Anabas testudineus]|uniref:platelet endothelial cell adhesion molecule isoform X3 n=1 Tax=Anabas testudineus TaxID=64144 RepID=UPI000E456E79|nr:platelet endothelial cell adhesion molecule isoform X3 [Anabas testudineus]
MGLLLLLTYTFVSSYVLLGTEVDAQRSFTIRRISLSIEPSTNVTRGTDVTVRCKAIISSSGSEPLSREYTVYKGSKTVYTKNSSTSEDLLYPLPEARATNSGKYMCKIKMGDKEMKSEVEKLTVTGLSKPVLHLDKGVVTEGEKIVATCTAPGETGSMFFYFYDGYKLIHEKFDNSNQLQYNFSISSVGIHSIHCLYIVFIMPDTAKSERSNTVTVSVKELAITPVMEIHPPSNIFEGDQLNISCTVRNSHSSFERINLYLSQGTHLLSSGNTEVNRRLTAEANRPGDFECRLETGNIEKVVNQTVSVTELFSAPIVTMSPAEIFQKDNMTLTCKSERYAFERLTGSELTYSLEPPQTPLTQTSPGVFSGKALQYEFNYTCVAEAKGIRKHSETLTVRPKVSVSTPEISLIGSAVQGESFKILCQSHTGSLPINYTLLKNGKVEDTFIVRRPFEQAYFTIMVTSPDEIGSYTCEAKNRHREGQYSKRLHGTVIVPLNNLNVVVNPNNSRVYEGQELLLLCGVKGTPPITFKWHHNGNKLKTNTSNVSFMSYHIESLTKDDSGTYQCEASNQANRVLRSEMITIEVYMAVWKQALIWGIALLVVIVLVVVCVLYFKSKRGAASLYDGMEGRVTNGARDSVASLPTDISNRSSYSIPATV